MAACKKIPYPLVVIGSTLWILLFFGLTAGAQMITGVWQGKSGRQKLELKLVQQGDSLRGTAYYHDGAGRYRRYSIRGYFDAASQEAVWWDDQLLESKGNLSARAREARSDFNCPGSGKMMLDGRSDEMGRDDLRDEIHLTKTDRWQFTDEWDFVIDNYTLGANDPDLIDSIGLLVQTREPYERVQAPAPSMAAIPAAPQQKKEIETVPIVPPIQMPTVLSPEEKYRTRTVTKVLDIPLAGDSIEMRFYDNAEIDGDSISLFLNGKLIFQHIRLTGSAYKIRLAIADLASENELTMVAENLGSIPPNTSYMVAESAGQRYEARLESTEGSSASIRLFKPAPSRKNSEP